MSARHVNGRGNAYRSPSGRITLASSLLSSLIVQNSRDAVMILVTVYYLFAMDEMSEDADPKVQSRRRKQQMKFGHPRNEPRQQHCQHYSVVHRDFGCCCGQAPLVSRSDTRPGETRYSLTEGGKRKVRISCAASALWPKRLCSASTAGQHCGTCTF
jgi:hypothetical protein